MVRVRDPQVFLNHAYKSLIESHFRSASLAFELVARHDATPEMKIEHLTDALEAAGMIADRRTRLERAEELRLMIRTESMLKDIDLRSKPEKVDDLGTAKDVLEMILTKGKRFRLNGKYQQAVGLFQVSADYALSKGAIFLAKSLRHEAMETFSLWGRYHELRKEYSLAITAYEDGWFYAREQGMPYEMDRMATASDRAFAKLTGNRD